MEYVSWVHGGGHGYVDMVTWSWAVNDNTPVNLGYWGDEEKAISWYKDVIRKWNIKSVVAAADWDGEWLYKALAADPNIRRFYWLDVWCCNAYDVTVVPFPPYRKREPGGKAIEREWKQHLSKVRYAFACRTAKDFVTALGKMLKD